MPARGGEPLEPMERNRINLGWLVLLRWGAAAGQLVTVLGAWGLLGIPLPLPILFGLIGLGAASNLAATLWLRSADRVREEVLGGLMILDVLILTGLLAASGGPSNPFSTLYLVNIALAPVVLRPAWTWGLVAFSLICFGALFLTPIVGVPPGLGMHAHDEDLGLHLEGMWVAFGVGAAFIVYFVQRVTRELARRDQELMLAREVSARAERLASLATLAAGAAHELSSPLSTIAVVARELERTLENEDASSDARLIREQVDRCRGILDQMAIEAGEAPGEPFVSVTLAQVIEESTGNLPGGERLTVTVETNASDRVLSVPRRAVTQALRALAKNALEASGERPVEIEGSLVNGECRIDVRDRGSGMTAEVLARVGEPFFTTKRPGAGMGLGVFLARTVLTRLGGGLDLDSRPGRGTTARIRLPIQPGAAKAQPGAHEVRR